MLLADFQCYFFLRTSKTLKNGEAPIYLRMEMLGARKDVSTKLSCHATKWNPELKLINATTKTELRVNSELMDWNASVKKAVEDLASRSRSFDLKDVKDHLLGKNESSFTLDFFLKRLSEIESEIGKGYSKSTHTNYRTTFKHLSQYVLTVYSRKDIQLTNVQYEFLRGFLSFLKTTKDCQTNTANKYMRSLRAVLYEAKKRGLIDRNPFENFQLKYDASQRAFLDEGELRAIMDKDFNIPRISQIRDIFIFSCFTGLAYADVQGLNQSHITERNGQMWIVKPRQKSKVEAMVPLLPQAEAILKRYANDRTSDGLLPIPSNQKVNAYLKEIADLCGVSKNLTFHMARHTFATTVALLNDVPVESVSRMLGHTSLKTTQIYGRVVQAKIEKDLAGVLKKYG